MAKSLCLLCPQATIATPSPTRRRHRGSKSACPRATAAHSECVALRQSNTMPVNPWILEYGATSKASENTVPCVYMLRKRALHTNCGQCGAPHSIHFV